MALRENEMITFHDDDTVTYTSESGEMWRTHVEILAREIVDGGCKYLSDKDRYLILVADGYRQTTRRSEEPKQ